MKYKFLLLCALTLKISISFSNTPTFFFDVNKEGIYKFKIPPSLASKSVFLQSEDFQYRVYAEGNFGYVYCPKKGFYQISNRLDSSKPIELSSRKNFKERNYYRYSLPNSLNSSHWFSDIISEGKPFELLIDNGIRLDEEGYLYIKLYNFKNSSSSVVIKVNGRTYNHVLTSNGDYNFSIPLSKSDTKIDLKVFSLSHQLGIENIYIDSFFNKKVEYEKSFEKYMFDLRYKLSKLPPNYFHGVIKKNKFYRLKKLEETDNLFVQRLKDIKEVTLRNIKFPKEITKNFIVIYNSEVFGKSDLENLEKILKLIDPNISYGYESVQNIYHKYSFSSPSSKAIKKFLHKLSPKHVLILGDASEKEDKKDIIPTNYYIQNKDHTRIETDFPYTYFKYPSNPKFSIGRLPFKSSIELSAYLEKLNKYLAENHLRSYAIYDDISIIDKRLNVSYTSYSDQNRFRKILKMNTIPSYINSRKPRVFQFIGHATFKSWSKNKKVDIEDMKLLDKNNIFSLIDLSCWTGTFAYHKKNSFSEDLIEMSDRGSVSTISSSGYTQIKNYPAITQYFVEKRGNRIGVVLNQLKKELFNKKQISLDDMHAFNLLGIPTLKY